MARVYQKCIESKMRMDSMVRGPNIPRHCFRLVLEYGEAWKIIESEEFDQSLLLSSACSPVLKELSCTMVEGEMLVRGGLSRAARRSTNTNSISEEMSFCLNLQQLLGCVDILKLVYGEAAGRPDVDYATSTVEVTSRLKRMKDCCKNLHHGNPLAACDQKISLDELRSIPDQEYNMGAFGPVQNYTWFNEKVAVKMLPGVDGNLLQVEASRLVSLQHPHLVQVIGYCIDEKINGGFLVMEYLHQIWSGGKSSTWASFPFEVALRILMQVAIAMKHLHDSGVPHCHLSTENVLVVSVISGDGLGESESHVNAKLSIFNLANFEFSKPGSLKTAPEVCSKPNDVYSFALMCIEILGGELAMSGRDVEIIGLPDQCPTFLTCYLKKCLDPTAQERPIFSGICDMLQLSKDIITMGTCFPSKLPSINKHYAEALLQHLGFELCTSMTSEGEPLLPPEIFLEVLIHELHRRPTANELRSVKWKVPLLRASQYYGGWTMPLLQVTEPMAIFDTIEKHLEKEAIWRLGLCYEFGRVVGVDKTKAATLYERAITQGFISAHVDLGLCYAFGRGVCKDRPRADKLWMDAIRHQNNDQVPLLSVAELIQSLKTLISDAEKNKDETSLHDIKTRVLQLTTKSGAGTELVAGPSYCNISSLSSLKGQPVVDDILLNLTGTEDVRNYLQENHLIPASVGGPTNAGSTSGIRAVGKLEWARDRVEDFRSVCWKYKFRFFAYGSTFLSMIPPHLIMRWMTYMAIGVFIALYRHNRKAAKLWGALVFFVVIILPRLLPEWLLTIVAIDEIFSHVPDTPHLQRWRLKIENSGTIPLQWNEAGILPLCWIPWSRALSLDHAGPDHNSNLALNFWKIFKLLWLFRGLIWTLCVMDGILSLIPDRPVQNPHNWHGFIGDVYVAGGGNLRMVSIFRKIIFRYLASLFIMVMTFSILIALAAKFFLSLKLWQAGTCLSIIILICCSWLRVMAIVVNGILSPVYGAEIQGRPLQLGNAETGFLSSAPREESDGNSRHDDPNVHRNFVFMSLTVILICIILFALPLVLALYYDPEVAENWWGSYSLEFLKAKGFLLLFVVSWLSQTPLVKFVIRHFRVQTTTPEEDELQRVSEAYAFEAVPPNTDEELPLLSEANLSDEFANDEEVDGNEVH